MFIDTHCHLDFPDFDSDRNEVIQRAKQQGIGYIINVGSSLRASQASVDLAGQYDFIYASAGIHPHDADKVNKETLNTIAGLCKSPRVVAVGEIGLDYYRGLSSVDNQKQLFINLLRLAESESLPVIIHCRQAQQDVLKILKDNNVSRGVVHCFSGDEAFLKQCLDLGFYISFTCNLTYKKADNLRRLARITPLERLLLETDAPFLAPEGFRGKRNEPVYVKYLAKKIAEIKEIKLEEIEKITTVNAQALFRLNRD
ncbi:MAG: TatD family hydrolase [Candidatus Omnitrophica bacterium]|nr:TatD family hydrolase [Candidatus Omnitrophota bacterium]MBU1871181.1 TatD family hydrolase [Candidatus Omnitrophota bacterium]